MVPAHREKIGMRLGCCDALCASEMAPRRPWQAASVVPQARAPAPFEIEHEFEFGGPHHRQIARLLAFENTAEHALNCYSIFVMTCAGSSAKCFSCPRK
jgi:hypothetical protein